MTQELSPELQARLDLMRELSVAARAITVPLYREGMTVENKAARGFDPVTNADTEAERVLRALISKRFPDDAIEGEEFDDRPGTSGYLWTLDPIDGTRAFVAGVPVWSTLIALSEHREGEGNVPVLGLIDLPAMEASYWGVPGRAWREDANGETPLSTRACGKLSDAILGCTAPFGMFTPGELAAFTMINSGTAFSRLGLDAFGHALVAQGRMDIIVEAGMKPCDVRALIPVVEGAGGKVTDWHGGSAADGGRVVVVGDEGLLGELYEYLGRALS